MPERGEVRPASDDYALYADEMRSRGKLLPCPGCGDAPDHVEDDPKCVANRARDVRQAQIALEHEQHIKELEELRERMID
jgi:hypothetical protein